MMLRRYHKSKEVVAVKQSEDLINYSIKELREMCKERGLTGYSKKNEAELIEILTESGE